MTDFKVGDRVECTDGCDGVKVGMRGTVVNIGSGAIDVNWDDNVNGHTCDGECEMGHGWNLVSTDLKLVKDQKIKEGINRYVAMNEGGRVITQNTMSYTEALKWELKSEEVTICRLVPVVSIKEEIKITKLKRKKRKITKFKGRTYT